MKLSLTHLPRETADRETIVKSARDERMVDRREDSIIPPFAHWIADLRAATRRADTERRKEVNEAAASEGGPTRPATSAIDDDRREVSARTINSWDGHLRIRDPAHAKGANVAANATAASGNTESGAPLAGDSWPGFPRPSLLANGLASVEVATELLVAAGDSADLVGSASSEVLATSSEIGSSVASTHTSSELSGMSAEPSGGDQAMPHATIVADGGGPASPPGNTTASHSAGSSKGIGQALEIDSSASADSSGESSLADNAGDSIELAELARNDASDDGHGGDFTTEAESILRFELNRATDRGPEPGRSTVSPQPMDAATAAMTRMHEDRVRVELDASVGKITLLLHQAQEGLKAHIVTPNEAAHRMMAQEMDHLRQHLEEAGIGLSEFQLDGRQQGDPGRGATWGSLTRADRVTKTTDDLPRIPLVARAASVGELDLLA